MAVLAHSEVSQMERYAADPRVSDAAVLASLGRMGEARQEQAVATLQMAAGITAPPALLVWAAQEVGSQLRQLIRQALQRPDAAAELPAQPWYPAALQLARHALAGTPQFQQQPGSQGPQSSEGQPQAAIMAAAGPRTELQLLRAFADPSTPLGSTATQWDALMSLPGLLALLQAAAALSRTLAASLKLIGMPPPSAESTAQPAEAAWLLPQLHAATAAARARAVEAADMAASGQQAEAPLDADAVLTAVAQGRAEPAAAREAAADWLAAASMLRHAEERLGCIGVSGGAAAGPAGAAGTVAAMHLLGLPLEPPALAEMKELRVSDKDLSGWLKEVSSQLATAAPSPSGSATAPAAAAITVPRALDSLLSAARSRLATGGRALVLLETPADAAATADAAAAAAWLRAAGAPLAAALLSGGYGSLRPLRAMAPELREALLLRLLEGGRPGGGAAALAAALYGDAEGALAAARADAVGAAGAADQLLREGVEAELDLVRERFVPPPPAELPTAPPLPSDHQLAEAVRSLPAGARELFYNHYALRPGGDAHGGAAAAAGLAGSPANEKEAAAVSDVTRAAGRDALRALLGGVSEGGIKDALELKELRAWLAGARSQLLAVPRPLLSLLLRFVRVQMSATPESAQLQRRKLLALLVAVAEQQARVTAAQPDPAAAGAGAGGVSALAAEAEAVAVAEAAAEAAAAGLVEGRMPPGLARLLGEQGVLDFASWVQALALNQHPSASTHDLLEAQHLEMDVERYLTMTHDPRLHLPLGGLGPSPAVPPTSADWRDPALRRSEGAWLEAMRPQLDAYLRAMSHRPLGDAEWAVYRDAALAEWEAGREAREDRLAATGESGFHNPRADEAYLQQLLERSIAPGDPLGGASRRYLDTLIRNPSWTFAQRLQAVQRLIQLNDHFLRQPTAPEEGSPFAPLFAQGGPDPVPRLAPLAGGMAAKGGPQPLRLPDGF
ncbi:hypothetical protein GPECTOR_63g69 [Gonium pectorale]|uniref:Uncharacterized protein n=1 Tax=Gonium pectorale TaxID=33097 RepID=A0A150G4J3_GONPE|nr:hypothetical protein GPECTOR_63g69 [Gonium pectorale]|eukprot:KXZ44744.1 hypothetical protein GPECTOR_63g69 [Gonium pectorale]